MNEIPVNSRLWHRWIFRIAIIPVVAILNSAIILFNIAMASARSPRPVPPLWRLFLIGVPPAIAWVALSIPVQFAARRLARQRIYIAVVVHSLIAVSFHVAHSVLTVGVRVTAGLVHTGTPLRLQLEQQLVVLLSPNLLVYAALVAGTLAWDNWRLSVRREKTAAHLAAQLTRAELAALRSRMQPHFLFNALHGISSVMDTNVALARRMMAALSRLLRSSLSAGGEYVTLEQELQLTRDYLDLQHMRFEERLRYDLQIDVDPQIRVPSFILQPLVENAVVHGMADRSEPTWVRVKVRTWRDGIEIDVSDNGPGFPQRILDGTKPLGLGLGALRARLLALPGGSGTMTLGNRADGGAQVIVRVPTSVDATPNA